MIRTAVGFQHSFPHILSCDKMLLSITLADLNFNVLYGSNEKSTKLPFCASFNEHSEVMVSAGNRCHYKQITMLNRSTGLGHQLLQRIKKKSIKINHAVRQ